MRYLAQLIGLAIVTALLITALPAITYPFPVASVKAQETSQAEDRKAEAERLFQLGVQQYRERQLAEALGSWQQALTIYRNTHVREAFPQESRRGEVIVLAELGMAFYYFGQTEQAVNLLQESFNILPEPNSQHDYSIYFEQYKFSTQLATELSAEEDYQRSIEIYNELLENLPAEAGSLIANVLNDLSDIYRAQGSIQEAYQFREYSLAISTPLSSRAIRLYPFNKIGEAYILLGQYQQAVEVYLSALDQEQAPSAEVGIFNNLGITLAYMGQYQQALNYYQLALSGFDNLDPELQELEISLRGNILGNTANTYYFLGQYQKAIDLHKQALSIYTSAMNKQGEASSLNNLGNAYSALGYYQQAFDAYERALEVFQDTGDKAGEANTLNNLGATYYLSEDYEEAVNFHQAALGIEREINSPQGEADSLNNLGNAQLALGQDQQAIDSYWKSLVILSRLDNRRSESIALGNIGVGLQRQGHPNLAIVFYKESVNAAETIRADIQGLSLEAQKSFTQTFAKTYRLLADLLLEQGRIPEAQQVLDLLKLEELREFTNTRATWTGSELAYTAAEQPVIDAHGSLIALGSAILTCEDTNCAELNSLYDQREALTAQYNDQVNQFANTIRANRRDDEDFQDPQELSDDAKSLLSAYAVEGQTPVLIYPFVLEDKLWLVWAIEGRVIGSAEVPVTQGELANTVQRFGELLTAPTRLDELQTHGQQLYNWIIQPLEAELATNNIDHLIFVNDRVTRYIPMAALYDGEQFLAERYQISTVLTPGTTDTRSRLADVESSQVLGLGLTQAVANFNPLPAVATELDGIVQSGDDDAIGIYPGQVLLNEAFTLEALKANLRPDYQVLHLATHAAFVPGRADESFIVLGNGDRLTTADIEDMNARLDNLHLVILSACQTAVGGPAGDGAEITGISSYFLGTDDSRAETVIASLWAVNDTSTSVLMQRFYELLATGELTKAEALRQAQLSLLYDEDTETRLAAVRGVAPIPTAREGFDVAVVEPGYRHPYYWAPFILIGNGL